MGVALFLQMSGRKHESCSSVVGGHRSCCSASTKLVKIGGSDRIQIRNYFLIHQRGALSHPLVRSDVWLLEVRQAGRDWSAPSNRGPGVGMNALIVLSYNSGSRTSPSKRCLLLQAPASACIKSSRFLAPSVWVRYIAPGIRLNRDVCHQVLPELSQQDPDRVARFKREASPGFVNHQPSPAFTGRRFGGGGALVMDLSMVRHSPTGSPTFLSRLRKPFRSTGRSRTRSKRA